MSNVEPRPNDMKVWLCEKDAKIIKTVGLPFNQEITGYRYFIEGYCQEVTIDTRDYQVKSEDEIAEEKTPEVGTTKYTISRRL